MYFIAIIMAIISMAVPIMSTSNIGWAGYTEYPALTGCAAYYSKGVMPSTATALDYITSNKAYNSWLEENGYIGAVAVYRLGDKGRDVHILWPDGTIDGPYLAIDVVARNHYRLGMVRNRVIDVDYATAMKHEMAGPMAVTIIYDNSWFLSMAYGDDNELITGITTDKYGKCLALSRRDDG